MYSHEVLLCSARSDGFKGVIFYNDDLNKLDRIYKTCCNSRNYYILSIVYSCCIASTKSILGYFLWIIDFIETTKNHDVLASMFHEHD